MERTPTCNAVVRPTGASMRKLLAALVFVLGFSVHAEVWPNGEGSEAVVGDKHRHQVQPLTVELTPVERTAAEPFRLHLLGNKTFFLYLFWIGEDGQPVFWLPSRAGQRQNRFRGQTPFVIPREDLEGPNFGPTGQKTLAVVGSTKELPAIPNWYPHGAACHAHVLGEDWETKERCACAPARRDEDLFVTSLTVNFAEDGIRTPDLWLTTTGGRAEYAVGERIEAVFGAELEGWIRLYEAAPNGECNRLVTKRIGNGRSVLWSGEATRPSGEHSFVASYSQLEPNVASATVEADQCQGTGVATLAYQFRVRE